MTFEQDYKDLKKHARVLINSSSIKGYVEPEDLVNAAYIKLIDSGKPYNFQLFKNFIGDSHYSEVNHQKGFISIEDGGEISSKGKLPNESYCTGCKDNLNANAFYTSFNKQGCYYYLHSKCKECEKKRARELYRLRHPKKPKVIKEKKKVGRPRLYDNTWIDRNKEKWNEYMRKRRSKAA